MKSVCAPRGVCLPPPTLECGAVQKQACSSRSHGGTCGARRYMW